jgi:hypothetical protein
METTSIFVEESWALICRTSSKPWPRFKEIDEHEIGMEPAHQGHGFGGAVRFAADLEVLLTAEKIAEPAPHQRMIVHDQNANDFILGRR